MELNHPPRQLPGIRLGVAKQLQLVRSLPAFKGGPRYRASGYFGLPDAFALGGILTLLQPRSVIEVGSGYSSAVMLDSHEAAYTFIDPEPERLRSLLLPGDSPAIIERPVQEVPLELFDTLDAGDMLFVDSSHIAKMGSDVNHLIFDVLPRLRPEVWVHFHDIFWPFEYPREWIDQGWLRTEAYLLRAFLTDNPKWRIRLWSSYLSIFFTKEIPEELYHGASLWLSRKA